MTKKTHKAYRDAITGQFTSKSEVKKHPKTTTTETIPNGQRKATKRK